METLPFDQEGLESADAEKETLHYTQDEPKEAEGLEAEDNGVETNSFCDVKGLEDPLSEDDEEVFVAVKPIVDEKNGPTECKGNAEPTTNLMDKLTFSNGKSLEEVKAETWISQADSKLRVRRAKENFALAPKEEGLGVPPKPASWGKLPQLSPDEQCPPKKRGRKPKAKEAGSSTPTEDAAASKPRSKRSRPSNANDSDEARPTPAQRLRSYLDGLPNKRKAETTEVEANPPACKKRRTRKPKEDEPGSKAESTRSKKGRSKDNSKDEGKSKGSKVMTKEQAEKRAKASRKSSAYHVAYRATEGTVEEKKAAAKR